MVLLGWMVPRFQPSYAFFPGEERVEIELAVVAVNRREAVDPSGE